MSRGIAQSGDFCESKNAIVIAKIVFCTPQPSIKALPRNFQISPSPPLQGRKDGRIVDHSERAAVWIVNKRKHLKVLRIIMAEYNINAVPLFLLCYRGSFFLLCCSCPAIELLAVSNFGPCKRSLLIRNPSGQAMASNSIFSLWNQGWGVVKASPVAIILAPIVLNLLWNKFQPGLVKIPGPALAAYTKL
jgi:hypothetical protein